MPPRKPTNEVFQLWKIKRRRRPLTISRSKSRNVGLKINRVKCSCCGKYSNPKRIPKNVKFHSPPLGNSKRASVNSNLAQERQRTKLRCTRHATPHPMPRITNVFSTPRRYDTISSTRNRIRKYVISKKNQKSKSNSSKSSSPSDVSSMDISPDSSDGEDSSQTDAESEGRDKSSDTSYDSEDSEIPMKATIRVRRPPSA